MIHYKIGSLEYTYDEEKRSGFILMQGKRVNGNNPVILYNSYMSELDRRLRNDLQAKLESAGIDKYTGKKIKSQ